MLVNETDEGQKVMRDPRGHPHLGVTINTVRYDLIVM